MPDGKHITDVRGRGLMVGVEFDIPQADVRKPLVYDQHCLTGCAGSSLHPVPAHKRRQVKA
ncbi:MAG: hypothetical protein IJ145_06305 [Prevotella sp.]|nr:hypothetical protein [Prevotella sp.]